MRVFDRAAAGVDRVGGLEVARWEQYALGDRLPFRAMWFSVPPGSRSALDRHPEIELSLVVSGSAGIEAGGTVAEVAAGSSYLLDGDEAHVVHNRSATEPLVVFSAYWTPVGSDA